MGQRRRRPHRDTCRHGLAAGTDPSGHPRCPLCRHEAGLPVPVTRQRRAPTGRCPRPGHEAFWRAGCPACAGEAAARRDPPSRPDPDATLPAEARGKPRVPRSALRPAAQ